MYTLQKITPIFFVLMLTLAALAVIPLASASPITVNAEKDSYDAGETLNVSGVASPGALVSIQLFDPDNVRKAIAQAEANSTTGEYSIIGLYTFDVADKSGTWTIKAYDSVTGEWAEDTVTLGVVTPPTVKTLEERVSELEEKVATLESQVSDLSSTVADLESKITTLEGTITTLQSKITTLEGKVTALEGTVTTLSTSVTELGGAVQALAGASTMIYVALILAIIAIILAIVCLVIIRRLVAAAKALLAPKAPEKTA